MIVLSGANFPRFVSLRDVLSDAFDGFHSFQEAVRQRARAREGGTSTYL